MHRGRASRGGGARRGLAVPVMTIPKCKMRTEALLDIPVIMRRDVPVRSGSIDNEPYDGHVHCALGEKHDDIGRRARAYTASRQHARAVPDSSAMSPRMSFLVVASCKLHAPCRRHDSQHLDTRYRAQIAPRVRPRTKKKKWTVSMCASVSEPPPFPPIVRVAAATRRTMRSGTRVGQRRGRSSLPRKLCGRGSARLAQGQGTSGPSLAVRPAPSFTARANQRDHHPARQGSHRRLPPSHSLAPVPLLPPAFCPPAHGVPHRILGLHSFPSAVHAGPTLHNLEIALSFLDDS